MRDSLDEEEGGGSDHAPAYDPASRQRGDIARDDSPLPAPKPQKPIVPPRESLDGDTIFAVGEDDKWSSDDDESDDESEASSSKAGASERARLTSRKNA